MMQEHVDCTLLPLGGTFFLQFRHRRIKMLPAIIVIMSSFSLSFA